VLIVAGAVDFADSRQAVETAVAAGARVHLVETAGDVRAEWLGRASTVGLTAGLGAAPKLTGDVLRVLSGLGPLSVARTTVHTDVVTA
jgi:4-hydroxy-3-methylbut-2-en-1-yl diphosphate reductase